MENLIIFANKLGFVMETVTLSYEPESDFAIALDELIRNSVGVRVIRRTKTRKCTPKKTKEQLIKEIIENAPQNVPLTDEEIQNEVNAVRYCL